MTFRTKKGDQQINKNIRCLMRKGSDVGAAIALTLKKPMKVCKPKKK